MKMRRVKLRVNHSQLLFLSREETSGSFQREGTLRVGRQERDLSERFCRLRGNLLFILKKQGGHLEEVLLLERCEVMKLPDDDRRLAVVFVCGDPALLLEASSSAECSSWLAVLRDANTDALRRRIARLCTLIDTHTSQHTHTAAHCSGGGENLGDAAGGVESAAKVSPLHLRVECRGFVAVAASRVKVQVCVIDTHTHTVRKHCCCKMVEGPDDSVFLTSVCFRGDYPLYHHSRIKINVYHEEELTTHTTMNYFSWHSNDSILTGPAGDASGFLILLAMTKEEEEEEEEEVMEGAERYSAGVQGRTTEAGFSTDGLFYPDSSFFPV